MQVSLRYDTQRRNGRQPLHRDQGCADPASHVDQFEELLSRVLLAGANHIYDIDFSTSELRKHRDAARALAMKAAQEKATISPRLRA